MKKIFFIVSFSIATTVILAQSASVSFNVKEYTLKNGMKVFIDEYKEQPRIQTYIVTKAGSKNDPADATGLAHYLEHMLFKGTDKFGTSNYEKEKVYLAEIENLYETYRSTKNDQKRKEIYHQIDSVSGVAAKYAIANEYDKAIAGIGGTGDNAYTSFDETVYYNSVPSNQINNWIDLQYERFRKPVLRIFHTELEAVYEEKNRHLDNDGSKAYEILYELLFQNHTYGTQTTIGTIDHLKNPSIKKIQAYYDANYVPNNMAIILSGDINSAEVLPLLEEKFGKLQPKAVNSYTFKPEEIIKAPIKKEIFGREAEFVMMGYRLGGATTSDAPYAELLSKILYNGTAGLFDIDLNQSQKVLSSGTMYDKMKDYSVFVLYGECKEKQKLEDVQNLMIKEIEKVKKGEIPDWLLTAAKNNIKLDLMKKLTDIELRGRLLVENFVFDDKASIQAQIDLIMSITKEQLIQFAQKNFTNNYAVVLKKQGEDKSLVKVEKPAITPIEVNQREQSPFLQSLLAAKTNELKPRFVDLNKDVTKLPINKDVELIYKQNTLNELGDLYYVFKNNHTIKGLDIALEYFEYLGSNKYTAEQLKQELYKLGCSCNIFDQDNIIYLQISGLSSNILAANQLIKDWMNNPRADEKALVDLKETVTKSRIDNLANKGFLLQKGLKNYGLYGNNSPLKNTYTNSELKNISSMELLNNLKQLFNQPHTILSYTSYSPTSIHKELNTQYVNYISSANTSSTKQTAYAYNQPKENTVYVLDYKDMQQAEVLFVNVDTAYSPTYQIQSTLFNEYYSGGMASILFQTIRESKALAYSVHSDYKTPMLSNDHFIFSAYVGTQADKLKDAMFSMDDLLRNFSKNEISFNAAKENLKQSICSNSPKQADMIWNYFDAQNHHLNYDINKDLYSYVTNSKIDNAESFFNNHIKRANYNIMILADLEKINKIDLEKYGKVKILTKNDLFNY